MLGVLGRGSFGSVHLVRHRQTQELYALKQIEKDRIRGAKHIQHVKNEKQIVKDISAESLGLERSGQPSFFVNFLESLQDE